MCWFGAVVLLCLSAAGSAALGQQKKLDLPDPPKPNREQPVDYVTWLDEVLAKIYDLSVCEDHLDVIQQVQSFEGDWGDTLDGPWTENREVERWLRQNRRALQRFAEIGKRDDCRISVSSLRSNPDQALVHCSMHGIPRVYRDICRGLMAECYHNPGDELESRLLETADIIVQWDGKLHTLGMVIPRLIATAGDALAWDALLRLLGTAEEPAALADRQLAKVIKLCKPRQPPELLVFCEHVVDYSTWQQGDRFGDREAEYIAALDRCAGLMAEHAQTPIWRAQDLEKRIEECVEEVPRPGMANLTTPIRLEHRLETIRRGTLLTYVLWDHYHDHGKFPRTLDELEAPIVRSIRTDPFSGKDFVYKKRRGTFKLYSVWKNRKDDGGKHQPSEDKEAEGDARADKDYVFWPPT
jgi:hypothetical protein